MHSHEIETYGSIIRRYPIMGREEETELLKGWDKPRNRSKIRQRMIEGSLRFAVQIAMEMHKTRGHITPQDAVAEANLGLVEAAKRFDPSKGFRFITYAVWWIRQAVRRAQDESHTVRRAHSLLHDLGAIVATQDALRMALEREPTDGELVDALNGPELEHEWTAEKLDRVREQGPVRNARFDEPIDDEVGQVLSDRLPDESATMPDEAMAESDVSRLLKQVSEGLSERQWAILVRHNGLDGGEPATLRDLGDEMGITRERVRQIEQDAREKIIKRHGRTLREALA